LDLENYKKTLKKEKRKEIWLNFFNIIKIKDLRRQLALLAIGLNKKKWKPEPVEYSLKQKRITKLLY